MRRGIQPAPRILVTDAQERSMLAVIRCLAQQGLSLTAVGANWGAPGLWSRRTDSRRSAPDPRQDSARFLDVLEAIVRRERHDLLLPGTDASLYVISRDRDRLTPHVRLGLPDHATVIRALDKASFLKEADEVGLQPPPSYICERPEDARVAAQQLGYPVVVKPASTVVEAGSVVRRWATCLAPDGAAVEAAAGEFGACVVQRRVPGAVISFGGVAGDRRLVGVAVSRYVRTWPPPAGNVSFSETIAAPPALVEQVQELVSRLGWEGIFEVELIERRELEFAAIDFNPRAYGSLALAVAAGTPLPALWCRFAMGERPVLATARPGVRYRWEDADIRHMLWQLRRRRGRAALAPLRPRRGVTHAYFRLHDPAPALARAVELARRLPWLLDGGPDRRRRAFDGRGIDAAPAYEIDAAPPGTGRSIALERVDALEELAELWPGVAEQSGNVFATWEWISTWWRHFGQDRPLRIGLARSENGGPGAILPLYVSSRRPLTVLRFLGHGPGDWQGPIHAPADESLATEAMATILEEMDDWDLLLAEHVRPQQPWLARVDASLVRREGYPMLPLEHSTWEDFLAERSRNFRDQVRRRERRLARNHRLRYRLSDAERLDSDMRLLFRLHEARWGARASGALAAPRQAFHLEFARLALLRGWLRLWVMELDDQPAAVWYGFRFADVEWYYQAGWDPAFSSESVGFVLLSHTIRSAMEEGASAYWFLRGAEAYKGRFAELDPGTDTAVVPGSAAGHIAAAAVTRADRLPAVLRGPVKKLAG